MCSNLDQTLRILQIAMIILPLLCLICTLFIFPAEEMPDSLTSASGQNNLSIPSFHDVWTWIELLNVTAHNETSTGSTNDIRQVLGSAANAEDAKTGKFRNGSWPNRNRSR